MSAPHSFGRVAGSTGNGKPVVRSARIKAIAARQLAPHDTTTTAPVNVGALSTSRDPVDNAPVPRSNSGTRKRSHDSSLSDEESGADSEGNGVELTEAPSPHKKPKSKEDQAEEVADAQSPTEIRSVANEAQPELNAQSDQVKGIADIQSPTETRDVADEGPVKPKPQSDQAEEDAGIQDPTGTRSAANEGQVEPQPQTDQTKDDAGIENPTSARSVANEGHADNEPSLPEADQSFYHAIIAAILWLRVLDQQRAAQKECSSKISILHRLMSLERPSLLNVPVGTKYPNVRGSLRSDFERYERLLETRSAQAETAERDVPHLVQSSKSRMDRFDDFIRTSAALPDVACLKDSAEFQAIFERCRSSFRSLADIDDEISDEEREIDLAQDRIDAYARRLATRGLEVAGLTAAGEPTIPVAELKDNEYSPAQEFRENTSTRLARRQELKAGLHKTEQTYFEHKENLAKIAEKLLIEAGMLEPGAPHMENPVSASNTGEHPEAVGGDDSNLVEPSEDRPSDDEKENAVAKRKAQHDALIAELMSAQRNLCDAEKAFENSRKFTEEEFAKLPNNITEDELGQELKRKLTRTTRDYIDAQKRVQDAQAEGRRLRVPEVDRYPIDQTWDFEDRTDDGYLNSVFANKVERSKPKVEEWLPQVDMSGGPLPPPIRRKMPKTLRKLAALRLGDDNVEDFSSDGAKERIAGYQKACEEIRKERLFPIQLPDTLIEGEQSRHLNSHMI